MSPGVGDCAKKPCCEAVLTRWPSLASHYVLAGHVLEGAQIGPGAVG